MRGNKINWGKDKDEWRDRSRLVIFHFSAIILKQAFPLNL